MCYCYCFGMRLSSQRNRPIVSSESNPSQNLKPTAGFLSMTQLLAADKSEIKHAYSVFYCHCKAEHPLWSLRGRSKSTGQLKRQGVCPQMKPFSWLTSIIDISRIMLQSWGCGKSLVMSLDEDGQSMGDSPPLQLRLEAQSNQVRPDNHWLHCDGTI